MTADASGAPTATRSPAQLVALAFGMVFLLVGVLGFVPGITADYGGITFAGPGSSAMLLGLFHVSYLHNIVHLLFGVAGILMASTAALAINYLVGSGVIYVALWLYGLAVDEASAANFVPVNPADNWLHLALAVGFLGSALALGVSGALGTRS